MGLIPDLPAGVKSFIGPTTAARTVGLFTRLLPVPKPQIFAGPGSSSTLGQAVGEAGHRRILIVTDKVVAQLGLMTPMLEALSACGAKFVVFDGITPDAPLDVVEQGIKRYQAEGCDAIVAFGGGSVIDAAKAIGIAAANKKNPRQLVGYFRSLRSPPPLYAVPTTAGTGSEVTVAAVIADPANHQKLVIADTRLVPKMAALDPNLMIGLPPPITAATGMDALTHAIESYIGLWGTAFTDRMALSAVSMIFENLPVAYRRGADLTARERMAEASMNAGLAFTRANVGNTHAIAHQLGGRYHTPHGLANAIMLPHVLRFSSPAITAKLAVLAVHAKAGKAGAPEAELAQNFLDAVDALNQEVGIPRQLDTLREQDIPELAKAACHEANTNYPVPRYMTQATCEELLRQVLPRKARHH